MHACLDKDYMSPGMRFCTYEYNSAINVILELNTLEFPRVIFKQSFIFLVMSCVW